jgi:di/tricarboxylate transporter
MGQISMEISRPTGSVLSGIQQRGLKNPTLLLIIIAYSEASVAAYATKFARNNNVVIFGPAAGETVDFVRLNALLKIIVPEPPNEA